MILEFLVLETLFSLNLKNMAFLLFGMNSQARRLLFLEKIKVIELKHIITLNYITFYSQKILICCKYNVLSGTKAMARRKLNPIHSLPTCGQDPARPHSSAH